MSVNIDKKYNIFYFIFFIILIIAKAIGLDGKDFSLIILTIFSGIFLMIKILKDKYTFRQIIIISIMLLLGIVIFLISKKTTVLISIIAIIFAKNISFKNLIKSVFIVRLISFLFIVFLSLIGVINNVKQYRFLENGEILIRNSLGFSHPNVTYLNFFILVLLYLYLYFDRVRYINYIIIIILSHILYLITDSRTGYLIVIISIIITCIFKSHKLIKMKGVKILLICMPIICSTFSIFVGLFYDSKNIILKELNTLLSGRLELSNRFLKMYKVKLFGQSIIEGSDLNGSYLRIDNGYISLLLGYGIIIFLIFVFTQVILLKKYVNEAKYKEVMLIVVFLIYGVTEVYIYNIFINISLLFISDLLYCIQNKTYKVKI